MSTVEFRLHRPSVDTAWGFRLQGGLEVNAPLTVQRVFNGSPADGNLQRGDVLLSINNHDVSAVYLKKAEELVKTSSNMLTIVVRRTGLPVNNSQPHNDLPVHQPVHRRFDSSPSSQPKYDHQPHQQVQAPPSFGSAHHPQPSRQLPQSNVWRPPTQSTESYNDHQSKPGSDIYHPVKNQWSSSTTHHGADVTDDYGHQRSGVVSAEATGASFRSVGGNQHQAGRGHTNAVQDDQLFPPFSGKSEERTASHGIVGANQNYFKQQPTLTSHVSAPQAFGHGSQPPVQHQQPPADEEETYEQKSVRDIKQMFNSPSKPLSFDKKQAPEKPKLWQNPSHDSADFSTSSSASWKAAPSAAISSAKPISMTSPSAMRSFASPPKASPSSNYYDDPYSYPPPRQESAGTFQGNRITSKPVAAQPKPGAGYSYQGIVTVTPAKTVHGKGKTSGGGGSGQGAKKKEFDPSQSLVFQALQEENERAKRGEVASPDEEPPRARSQQATHTGPRKGAPGASQHQQQQQQQQRSARLQELLERDQAQSQQADHLSSGVQPSPSSPHMSAQARREMSPSYPHFQQHVHQPNQQQQYQQAPAPTAHQRPHQHHSAATNHHQHHQQQYHHQQYQQSSSPSYGYQQPQHQSYHGGYESYDSSIPISDF